MKTAKVYTVTKYFSVCEKLGFDNVVKLARKDGLAVGGGKPGFVAWYCLKLKGPRKLIDAALKRIADAGVKFERIKPRGAWEMGEPGEYPKVCDEMEK